jgi:dienelactone hydrolase
MEAINKAREVSVNMEDVALEANLVIPEGATSIVAFAHGSGSSRFSPRNRAVASTLNEGGLATLLMDLLTSDEQQVDQRTAHLRFDIGLLAERVAGTVDWLTEQAETRDLDVGLFGASTGAAAALVAASQRPERVGAVVSRGGRPDLAGDALPNVKSPVLMIVGGRDTPVIGMNEDAAEKLTIEHQIEIVPGATHLFEEPGALKKVAELARDWFNKQLGGPEG